MPQLFIYVLKFSIAIGCFYTFYFLVLRRLTFYKWNRFYLGVYPLVCFLIPFIDVAGLLKKDSLLQVPLVAIPSISTLTTVNIITEVKNSTAWVLGVWEVLLILFISGMVLMIIRLIKQYYSIQKIRQSSTITRHHQIWLYDVDQKINPFSFGNNIYVNRQSHTEEELEKIIHHEFIHVKQKHTIDLLIGELVCIFNWFNPFAWLIRTAIRQNLEFIADNGVLESGADARQYQYLLLKVIGVPEYTITNHFSFTSLKKRITMMNKLRSAKLHLVKFLFLLPLCGLLLVAFRNSENKKKPAPESVYSAEAKRSSEKLLSVDTNPPVIAHPPLPPVAVVPAVPSPPAIPNVKKLPAGVKSIKMQDKKATISFDNGKAEVYNLNIAEQKTAFEKKFGEYAPPPPPVPPIPEVGIAPHPAAAPIPPVHPIQTTPPTPPEKIDSSRHVRLPSGTYTLSSDELKRILADASNRGEIFIGIDNPLDIDINHIRKEDLTIEWAGGNIIAANGVYHLRPTRMGKSKLIIFKKEGDGTKKLIKTLPLDAKRLPDPTLSPDLLKKENSKTPVNPSRLWPMGSPWSFVRDRC